MKILLINIDLGSADNAAENIARLEQCATKHTVETKALSDIADIPTAVNSFDGVVLSGAYGVDTFKTSDIAKLAQTLESFDKPVIGIGCGGFTLACQVLGIDLDALAEFDAAPQRIVPTDDGAKLFQGTDPLVVTETKRWLIEELPKSCQVLARSSDGGIEAIRHKKRPLTAIQLSPADFTYPSDAKMIYANLFASLGK